MTKTKLTVGEAIAIGDRDSHLSHTRPIGARLDARIAWLESELGVSECTMPDHYARIVREHSLLHAARERIADLEGEVRYLRMWAKMPAEERRVQGLSREAYRAELESYR